MGKPKAPTPPDPKETANAQTGTNVQTAQANAILGNVNQITPYGNLTYRQTGKTLVSNPDAGTESDQWIPSYTATQTLSPNQQRLLTTGEQAQINLAALARDQSGRLNSLLSKPLDTKSLPAMKGVNDYSADRLRVEDAMLQRMNPMMQRDEEAQRARLNNQGVMAGSKAYERGIDELGRARTDARLGTILAGGQEQSRLVGMSNDARNQALQEMLALRSQPVNEIAALMSGSQVTQPQFVNSNMPTIPTTDYAGLVQSNYQNQMGQYQQKMAQQQSMMGGLFGLGSAFLASDRRLKTDIRRIGVADNGLPIYAYKYVWGGPAQIGFMADEVESLHPEAVIEDEAGYKFVHYDRAVA